VEQFAVPMQTVFLDSICQWVVRIPVRLHLGVHGVFIRNAEFVIDSGSDITQLPESVVSAALRQKSFGPMRRFRSASGEAEGREIQFTFSFASLPDWTFPCIGLVNRHITRGLLAWRDVVRRFDIKTIQRTSIPNQRNRMLAGRPGALSFVLYPAAVQNGVRAHA
jgi:hypothetical protein